MEPSDIGQNTRLGRIEADKRRGWVWELGGMCGRLDRLVAVQYAKACRERQYRIGLTCVEPIGPSEWETVAGQGWSGIG